MSENFLARNGHLAALCKCRLCQAALKIATGTNRYEAMFALGSLLSDAFDVFSLSLF